ncbi:hypothetical protein L9F63_023666, partial [Diploptera punctata]
IYQVLIRNYRCLKCLFTQNLMRSKSGDENKEMSEHIHLENLSFKCFVMSTKNCAQRTSWCTMQCNLCTVPPKTSTFFFINSAIPVLAPNIHAAPSVVILHNFIQSSSILSTAFLTFSNNCQDCTEGGIMGMKRKQVKCICKMDLEEE